MLLTEFVPYMQQHCNLSRLEQEAQTRLASGDTLTPEETAYYWGAGGLRQGVPTASQSGTVSVAGAAETF